jgi:hypothetical protein
MKRAHCLIVLAFLLTVCTFSYAELEGSMPDARLLLHPLPPIQDTETAAQRDARMAWWREARLGPFIHWGLYSIPAGTWDSKQIPGIGEWIMNNASIHAQASEADPGLMLKLKDALSRKMVPLIDVEVYQDRTISPQTLQLFQATRAEIRHAKPSSQLETGEGLVSLRPPKA